MTEAYEEDWLVRVRAQVMCRDEATGGWLPLGGGGLSNVMVRKRTWTSPPHSRQLALHTQALPSTLEHQNRESGGSSSSVNTRPSSSGVYISPQPSSPSGIQPASGDAPPVIRGPSSSSSSDADVTISSNNNSLQRSLFKKNRNGTQLCQVDEAKLKKNTERSEYYIFGRRISDQSVILSCTIKRDFQYNKVMPTFHHWVTDEKRFGLTFQTAADARAFDKGVRTAIEDMLDGLGGVWPSLRGMKLYKDDEDNIFECLNLPSESRSSSENSTVSRSHNNRRPCGDEQTPICNINTVAYPPYASVTAAGHTVMAQPRRNGTRSTDTSPGCKDLLRKQKEGPNAEDAKKMAALIGNQLDADNYSYVQLTAVHEYIYPHLTAGGMSSQSDRSPASHRPGTDSATTTNSGKSLLNRRDSILSAKRHNIEQSCYTTEAAGILGSFQAVQPPPLPTKKRTESKKKGKDGIVRMRQRCRFCSEWYLESANKPGVCEEAPDCFKSCINGCTLMKCAQCMLYHCMSDAEGDFATNPCECNPSEDGFIKRWFGMTLLSICVPCLCFYPCLRAVHCCCACCGMSGGRHAPQH